MADDEPVVWLPFEVDKLGDPPDGLRYETVTPTGDDVPPSVSCDGLRRRRLRCD